MIKTLKNYLRLLLFSTIACGLIGCAGPSENDFDPAKAEDTTPSVINDRPATVSYGGA